ncbi:hypothetical protein [Lactobacillus crispatus]|uniref:Uncharacterized protein n=1 Tax=Lactobacillus crispatus TaxID=47770 RepID=A0AAN5W6B8_9LACO|nr:hypothetical protein [Lactobacillus crispatus]KAA8780229.1 hypothetical protein F1C01_10205 [Lactobacillus crispatus]KAA8793355.1 hypothetical protein F1C00_08185 [Lactobacillus crispatus]KAA8797949.1 hypothetical protein F1C02_05625 [Lactobacillus crispatus]KAA8801051.1 hypothetical protein F1C03_05700 [Lactobacillus crispatus]KAA8801994.1 hypothetical protein F1C04_09175 [Lactobacillus crispatus]
MTKLIKFKKWKKFDEEEKDKQQSINIIGYYFGFMLMWAGIFSFICWLVTITKFNFDQQFGISVAFNIFFWSGIIIRYIFDRRERLLEQ